MEPLRLPSLFGLLAANLFAQVGVSTLTGRSVDATQAAIPGASVNVINEESGAALAGRTNSEGIYRAPNLVPGRYRIEVNASGFDPFIRKDIVIEVAQTQAVDLVLRVGQQNLTVEVSGAPPVVDTQSSSIGQLVDQKSIDQLPIPNRAATSLVSLSPGVAMISSGEGAENYPVFAVAGGRARNQDFTLDGGNVTNAVGVTRPQQQKRPATGCDAGVPRHLEQLRSRVWTLHGWHYCSLHALGDESVSRVDLRIRPQ